MSTTKMYSGYDESRPTSKVSCPPGGRSNNIFGTEPPSYTAPQRRPGGGDAGPVETNTTGNRLFGEEVSSPTAVPGYAADAKVAAPPAGVNTQGGNRRNHVTMDQEEDSAISHCRKRFFKNEGRDGEEETEEEKRKRKEEEEEEKKKAASPARAKPPRGAYNPITGEDYPDKPSQDPAARTRQPPGGRTSGPLW